MAPALFRAFPRSLHRRSYARHEQSARRGGGRGQNGAEGVDGEKGCRKGARLLFGGWMNRRPELSDASTILGGWTVGLVRIKKDQPLLAAKNRGQSGSEKI